MNREIKFRAWDIKSKRMCVVAVLYLPTAQQFNEFTVDITTYDGTLRKEGLVGEDFILMQYTGLHDKNGKEIYEQDLIAWEKRPDDILLVVFDSERATFVCLERHKENWYHHDDLCMVLASWLTESHNVAGFPYVCGNIYETPEKVKE